MARILHPSTRFPLRLNVPDPFLSIEEGHHTVLADLQHGSMAGGGHGSSRARSFEGKRGVRVVGFTVPQNGADREHPSDVSMTAAPSMRARPLRTAGG